MNSTTALVFLLISCLPVSGQSQEPERPPEFVAGQKADRLYNYYLDAMMDTRKRYRAETRPGSSHGLKQIGKEDLVILINYEQTPK